MSPKKLIFAPIFLALILAVYYLFKPILERYMDIFFGPWGGLYELGLLGIVITLTSLSYCLFILFTQDIKYAVVLALLGSFASFIFLAPSLAIFTSVGFFVSFILSFYAVSANLTTYLNFRADSILAGPVRNLNTLLLFSLSITFYLYTNTIIQTQGFKVPDSLVEWAVDLSLKEYNIPVKGEKYLAQSLTPEQVKMLRQNPQVLEQFGLDENDIDQFVTEPDNTTQATPSTQTTVNPGSSLAGANIKDIIKSQISDSINLLLKPYLFAIPLVFAFLFYSLASLTMWIISLFLKPLITSIFYILEKTGFVKFEKEMREVKKLVI